MIFSSLLHSASSVERTGDEVCIFRRTLQILNQESSSNTKTCSYLKIQKKGQPQNFLQKLHKENKMILTNPRPVQLT